MSSAQETIQIAREGRADDDAALHFRREDWWGGFESLRQEHDYRIDEVEGRLPADLEGTLLRNGPGLLEVGGQRIQHPFDGDGMVSKITFQGGQAHFRNRYVRTEGFLAEQRAGRILYRGVFGTDKPGGWAANALDLRLKNIANTNVLSWGGRLYALWEAGWPHRLDPHTLDTLGLDDLGGALRRGQPFTAHPHVDPAHHSDGRARLVGFGVKVGLFSTITLYEFDTSGRLLSRRSHQLGGFAFLHDMAITPRYCIFFQNPVGYNPLPYALGMASAGECLQSLPDRPTRISVIPRDGGLPITLESEPCFIFHHANAFEDGDELVVDSICYARYPLLDPQADYRRLDFATFPPGQVFRYRIDLARRSVRRELISARSCEFPTLHAAHVGRPYRFVYSACAADAERNGPMQGIQKVDMHSGTTEVWSAAPRGFVDEPIFVPRHGPARMSWLSAPLAGGAVPEGREDEGYLLALSYRADERRSEVVVLDARDVAAGPIARLKLRHHIPFGLHGTFTPQVL